MSAPTASSPPRPTASPPTSVSSPSTTTTPAQPIHAHATSSSSAASAVSPPHLQSTLPSAEAQRHIEEARAAVVASMGNMLDAELQTRATMLHDNAAALDKQEADVVRATEALRREREKLAREADQAARKVKELGNVQNWAEVLERGFMVLEETVRLANGDGASGDGSVSGSGSCSCSCSDCGRDDDDDDNDDDGGPGDVHMDVGTGDDAHDGKTKKADHDVMDMDMLLDGDAPSSWSDASRSLMEPDSSTGTGMAKGSETASLSTMSGDQRQ